MTSYSKSTTNTIKTTNQPEDQVFAEPFLEFISNDIALNDDIRKLVTQNCELVTFKKGARLLEADTDCKYIYFIVEGEAISYFTDYNGKTITWFFHFNKPEGSIKNVFAVDYKSFLSRSPATLSIEALSDVTAIRFSRENIRLLTESTMEFERWIRMVNEKAFIMIYDRVSTLLTLSATERYSKFLREEPFLLNMFSNYYIASYLAVAPQSLSRIRKNI